MAGDNDKDKKGFSGLSDLASEVGGIDEPIKAEPKAEAKPSTPNQTPQPQREAAPSKPVRKTTNSPPPIETVSSGKSGGGAGGKWILGIIGVGFVIWLILAVIWLINNLGQSTHKPSYTPPSSSQSYSYPPSTLAPTVQTPSSNQSTGLQYTKPPVGTNNVLSVPEICWCIRERIRIQAMRDVIDTSEGIDEFNRIVDDYNSRCGNYRYHQGSQSRAERDVEPYRSQIVEEAILEAEQLGRSYQPSYPSVSPSTSPSSAPEKPNAQFTRQAQQLLTDLVYDPRPVDGDYGRWTADAVKSFQRGAGITQDGWIDKNMLSTLRRVKAVSKSSAGSEPKPQTQTSLQRAARAHRHRSRTQPKPQTQTSLQPLSNTPSAVTTTTPENLSYEEQSKYSAAQRLHARTIHDYIAERLEQSKYSAAQRLHRLGYDVDWQTSSLTDMLDAESRIGAANRLKRKGISVDWRNYSLTQLLNMEYGQK